MHEKAIIEQGEMSPTFYVRSWGRRTRLRSLDRTFGPLAAIRDESTPAMLVENKV